ncbi:MAG: hypothetical protein MJ060_04310 [Clostridia bacterium]|nr:hypothetical protein [Clostridia bacterium]
MINPIAMEILKLYFGTKLTIEQVAKIHGVSEQIVKECIIRSWLDDDVYREVMSEIRDEKQ